MLFTGFFILSMGHRYIYGIYITTICTLQYYAPHITVGCTKTGATNGDAQGTLVLISSRGPLGFGDPSPLLVMEESPQQQCTHNTTSCPKMHNLVLPAKVCKVQQEAMLLAKVCEGGEPDQFLFVLNFAVFTNFASNTQLNLESKADRAPCP